MNTEVNNQESSAQETWNQDFQNLLYKAHAEQLFAPDVLLVLQRAVAEIQHQINRTLYTHEHINEEGEK